MAPREVVMGLDKFERGVSFGAAAIALIFTAISLPGILTATTVRHITTAPAKVAPFCQLPYKYEKGINRCVHEVNTHPGYWLPGFLTFLIIGLFIFFFAYRKKRAGVIVSCLILGFTMNPTSSVGLPFMFAGGWLIIRAQRLNKYGDASFSGSSRKAKEISKARREGRSAPANDAPTLKSAPEASKRYTPKQRKRRR